MSAAPDAAWRGVRPMVFSYVLAGNVGGSRYEGSNPQLLKARATLQALLAEVRALPPAADAPEGTVRNANVFCIPAHTDGSYDFELATRYRRAFSELLADNPKLRRRLGGRGPFLIAARSPAGELGRARKRADQSVNGHVLLIDLGRSSPDAAVIFLKEFKHAVRREGIVLDRELTSLRGGIVSALLELNQTLPFIQNAYAGAVAGSTGTSK